MAKASLSHIIEARKRARDRDHLARYHALGNILYKSRCFERLFKLEELRKQLATEDSQLSELEKFFIEREIGNLVKWLKGG